MSKTDDLRASEEQLAAADPVVAYLWRYGYYQAPGADNAHNVRPKELAKLTRDDEITQEAVWAYQQFFKDAIDEESYLIHKRPAIADGLLGPATAEVMSRPRCGMPDYMARKEEARFPDSCVNKLTVSYHFDSINNALAREAWKNALKAWSDAIVMGFDLKGEFSRDTNVWATDSALRGSTLAWSMLTNGRCSDNMEQRYNTRVNWSIDYLWRVILHECGHAWGMGHINSRAAVMNPSITGHRTPQPMDVDYMVRLGYQKRTTPKPPPEPDGDTGAGTLTIGGQTYALIAIPTGG